MQGIIAKGAANNKCSENKALSYIKLKRENFPTSHGKVGMTWKDERNESISFITIVRKNIFVSDCLLASTAKQDHAASSSLSLASLTLTPKDRQVPTTDRAIPSKGKCHK